MLKNDVKKPSYLVGSRLGSILGDFLTKLGDFFSKSSGHTGKEASQVCLVRGETSKIF